MNAHRKTNWTVVFKSPDGHVVDQKELKDMTAQEASQEAERQQLAYGSRVEDYTLQEKH